MHWKHVFGIKSLQYLTKSQVFQQINVLKTCPWEQLHLSFIVDLFQGANGAAPRASKPTPKPRNKGIGLEGQPMLALPTAHWQ